MAIGPVVTRGFGSFGTVNLVVTRGYTSSVTPGTGQAKFFAVASEVYVAGSSVADVYIAGGVSSEVYLAGASVGDVA